MSKQKQVAERGYTMIRFRNGFRPDIRNRTELGANVAFEFENGMRVSVTEGGRGGGGPSNISLAVLDSDDQFITSRFINTDGQQTLEFAHVEQVFQVMREVREASLRAKVLGVSR
jgi:hypothetical protein